MTINRQDQFGYYTVGNLTTYSKFEAMIAEEKTGQKLVWNFNDQVYGQYDWTYEPEETLEELYRQRAQQIRDQYDYVVLWFSGGADSNNILNAFLDNDIKIDEIASCTNYRATGDKTNHLNGEIFHLATYLAESAQARQPGLKYTIFDHLDYTLNFYIQDTNKLDWIYRAGGHQSPNIVLKQYMKLNTPHWQKLFDSGKRVCFIAGVDKPWVSRLNGQYYFRFIDTYIDDAAGPGSQMDNLPQEHNDSFYWSPELPKLVIKQAHIIKRYIAASDLNDPAAGFVTDKSLIKSAPRIHIVGKGTDNWYMTTDRMHDLIYPNWVVNPFQAKSPSIVLSKRDTWFFDIEDSNQAKYYWQTGLKYFWENTPDRWKHDPKNILAGFKYSQSKIYCLGS
jgi:hypothetical protein